MNEFLTWASGILALINTIYLIYGAWKKLKPEVKKMELEADSEIADAANVNLAGAKMSGEMLMQRINELKDDLNSEKKARKEDIEYFKRRLKEIDREARDYRMWSARLAKQVIEAGKVPVPFISTSGDSDPLISVITKEQEQLNQTMEKREQELKDAGSNK